MAQPACVVCCCGDPEEIGFPCGDFEVPPLAPFGGWIDYDAGQTYCGWTVVSGSISIHHGLHNNLGLGNPNGPSQHMDLNGYSFGTVERTLTGLIPGKQYSITLWYAAHNGAGLATCHALINNGALLDETWSTSITGDIKWDQRCLNFIADASSVLLRLAGSSNNPCCGMLIDDMTMWSCDADTESPVIFNPPPVGYMMQCQQNIPPVPQLVVTDNCDSYPEITFVEWVDSLACQFNYLRIWIVEDICGNTTSFQQTIAVEDTEPPVITNPPKDFEIPCGFDVLEEFYSWIQLNGYGAALDNCDHSLDWTADFVEEPGPACSVVLVTFVVTDDCGHSAEATATFTVKEVPPVILVPAHDVSINCAQNPGDSLELWLGEWGGAVAFDPCEPLVWQHNFSGDSLAPVIEVTFSVTNACGSVTETTAFFFQTVASDTLNEMALTCDPSLVSSDTIIQGVEGCQTVIITRIDLSPSDTLHLFGTTCEPSLSGSDTIFLQNQYGCDSLVITQTDLLPSSTKNIQLYTCDPLGAGLDTFNLTNQYGCDSIIYLTTTYSGIYQETNTTLICGVGTDYADTLTVVSGPCDSLFITQYHYAALDTTWLTGTTCQAGQAGTFTQVLPAQSGCDSTIITIITLLQGDTTLVNDVTCVKADEQSDTLILQNQFGCDSMVIQSIAYVGIDTQYVQKNSCDPAQVGVVIQSIPGTFCDTIRMTETTWVPFTESLDTIALCMPSGPASDTLILVGQSGCDSLAIRIYHYTDLQVDLAVTKESCAGDADGVIQVLTTDGGDPPYSYRLDGGAWQQTGTFAGLPPGTYTLEIKDKNDCLLQADGQIIEAGSILTLDAGPDRTEQLGEVINLSAQATAQLTEVQWTATDPLGCETCLQSALGPLTVSQTVVVTGISLEGCPGQDELTVAVDERLTIYIPNSFSPNGDGINDVFTIYSNEEGLIVRNLDIFDRWGNALYDQKDLPVHDPTVGWNGTFRGEIMDPGVYVYVIKVEFADGSQKYYKGDVTIIR